MACHDLVCHILTLMKVMANPDKFVVSCPKCQQKILPLLAEVCVQGEISNQS